MLMPDDTCRTTLFVNCTCCTVHHGQLPPWLRGVNTMAYPAWPPAQLYSNTLPSTMTRWAFLSSKMFFTDHDCVRQASGFASVFPCTVMSDGIRFGTAGSEPPNMTFSPAASR